MDAKTIHSSHNNNMPEAGAVRVVPIAVISDLLHTHAGEPPEQILAELGIDLALFDEPENTISYVKGGQLFKLCAKRTGMPPKTW